MILTGLLFICFFIYKIYLEEYNVLLLWHLLENFFVSMVWQYNICAFKEDSASYNLSANERFYGTRVLLAFLWFMFCLIEQLSVLAVDNASAIDGNRSSLCLRRARHCRTAMLFTNYNFLYCIYMCSKSRKLKLKFGKVTTFALLRSRINKKKIE